VHGPFKFGIAALLLPAQREERSISAIPESGHPKDVQTMFVPQPKK
jgi:hypothetical protein